MTSIKVMYRPSVVPDKEGRIYYRIIHERQVRQLHTDYRVFPAEWDEKRSMIPAVPTGERKPVIDAIRENVRHDIERLGKIELKLNGAGIVYSADDLINEYRRYISEYTLVTYTEKLIAALRSNGKIRTAETYKATLSCFTKFLATRPGCFEGHGVTDILLDCIGPKIMEAYDAWMRGRGLSKNTVSFYTRILRAVYNRAVTEDVVENRHPFRKVYTGVDRTVKRALPISKIKIIKGLDLARTPKLDYARDIFMLSFYFRGMSFVDMAYLKKSDLKNGVLTYRRRKTGQQLQIGWTGEMQTLLDKYPENESEYLLPIIKRSTINERCAYRNAGYNINHSLKKVGGMIGITIPLTLYVARHSWASAAKAKGIPVSVISEGMGHDSEATTQIYLASLETSVVDRANALIIRALG